MKGIFIILSIALALWAILNYSKPILLLRLYLREEAYYKKGHKKLPCNSIDSVNANPATISRREIKEDISRYDSILADGVKHYRIKLLFG